MPAAPPAGAAGAAGRGRRGSTTPSSTTASHSNGWWHDSQTTRRTASADSARGSRTRVSAPQASCRQRTRRTGSVPRVAGKPPLTARSTLTGSCQPRLNLSGAPNGPARGRCRYSGAWSPWPVSGRRRRRRRRAEGARIPCCGADPDSSLPAARPLLPVRLSDRRAAERLRDHRRDPGAVQLLLRRPHRGLPEDPRRLDRPHRARGVDHAAPYLSAGPSDQGVAGRLPRRGAHAGGMEGGDQSAAGADSPRRLGADRGHDRPGLHLGGDRPRPQLAGLLPLVRGLDGRARLLGDPPLPDPRGRDAPGAPRHQRVRSGAADECGNPGDLVAGAFDGRPAADQPDHRPHGGGADLWGRWWRGAGCRRADRGGCGDH